MVLTMAGNTKEGYRKGAVAERSQVYNEKTKMYMKRDTTTGRFMSASENKYKGVRDEKKTKQKK